MPFLRLVPDIERAELLDGGHVAIAAAGRQLMRQGEPAPSMAILLEGRLRVSILSDTGREVTFRVVRPVEPVGEIGMLDGGMRTANVVAVEKSRLLVLPREHCLAVIARRPAVARAMTLLLCTLLRDTTMGLEQVATRRLPVRMANLLLKLAADYGRALPEAGILLPMRLSQAEFASLIAATREAVNKQLAAWREAGLIDLRRGQITLLRPELLAGLE